MANSDNITTLVQELMECMSCVHPELLRKQKFHLLIHLKDDMLDFGPPVGFATER